MKRSSLLLIAMLGMMATPVSADSSQGSGAPMPLGGAENAVVLSAGTTQTDIDAYVRHQVEIGRASYALIARTGGWDADFLPPAIAAFCWARATGDANPTGGPIGASMGGSDGGSAQ